jgi:hypothetical protein
MHATRNVKTQRVVVRARPKAASNVEAEFDVATRGSATGWKRHCMTAAIAGPISFEFVLSRIWMRDR